MCASSTIASICLGNDNEETNLGKFGSTEVQELATYGLWENTRADTERIVNQFLTLSFIKLNVLKHLSSSVEPKTCITTISVNLMYFDILYTII